MAVNVAMKDQFPFLSLPSELRNEIYSLTLDASDVAISYHYQETGLGKAIARRRSPRDLDHASDITLNSAIVVANCQIYHETFRMLYMQPLHFQDASALHSFLLAIGPAHRQMLIDITLHSWSFGYPLNRAALVLLSEATSLKRLRVQCDNCTGPGIVAVCAAQSACWDFGKWVEEVGLSKGRDDSEFVAERNEDGKHFCYSRTWVSKN